MNSFMNVSIPKITYLQVPDEIMALCDSLNILDLDVREAAMVMVSSQDGEIEVWVCDDNQAWLAWCA